VSSSKRLRRICWRFTERNRGEPIEYIYSRMSDDHRNIRHEIFYCANCNALYHIYRKWIQHFPCVYRLRQQTMRFNIDTIWQQRIKKKEIKEGLYVGNCKGSKKTTLVTSLPGRGNHVVYRYLYLSSSASRINKQFHICRSIIHSIFLFHLRDERWHIGNPPQCIHTRTPLGKSFTIYTR
jgi:hypothetical protein